MTKTLPFQNDSFDIIFHPVSNCFIEDIIPIWNECYRLLKQGGILLAGFSNGIDFLFEDRDREGGSAIREYAPQYMATRAVKAE